MTNLEILRFHKYEDVDQDSLICFQNMLASALKNGSVYRSLCIANSIETDYLLSTLKDHPYETALLDLWSKHRSDLELLLPVVDMVLASCVFKSPEDCKGQTQFWLGTQLKNELDPYNVLPLSVKADGVSLFDFLRKKFHKLNTLIYDPESFMGGVALNREFSAKINQGGEITVLLTHALHEDTEQRVARMANHLEEIVEDYIQSREILEHISESSAIYSAALSHLYMHLMMDTESCTAMLEDAVAENPRIFPEIPEDFYEQHDDLSLQRIKRLWNFNVINQIMEDSSELETYAKIILDHWKVNAATNNVPSEFIDWWDIFILENRTTEVWAELESFARAYFDNNDMNDYYEEEEDQLFSTNYSLAFRFKSSKYFKPRRFDL